MGTKKLISTIGLEDLLIVDTEDALFIGKKGESQNIKNLIDKMEGELKENESIQKTI
jgi:hypothetical protein